MKQSLAERKKIFLEKLRSPSDATKYKRYMGAPIRYAGGKSLALSDAMRGRGQVFAYDISEKKLLALRQRAKRAGDNNIKCFRASRIQVIQSGRSSHRTVEIYGTAV